jgi:hypothetical protein
MLAGSTPAGGIALEQHKYVQLRIRRIDGEEGVVMSVEQAAKTVARLAAVLESGSETRTVGEVHSVGGQRRDIRLGDSLVGHNAISLLGVNRDHDIDWGLCRRMR